MKKYTTIYSYSRRSIDWDVRREIYFLFVRGYCKTIANVVKAVSQHVMEIQIARRYAPKSYTCKNFHK